MKAFEGHNQRTFVGLIIFVILMCWVTGALALLTYWGWRTYPTMDEVIALSEGDTAADRVATFRDLRQQWLAEVKDLGMTLTVTPATALISAVIGFLLRGEKDEA